MRRPLRALALIALAPALAAEVTPESPPPDAGRVAPAPRPRAACPLRAGQTFTGTYVCAQGITDLTLRVLTVRGDALRVEFDFRHDPTHVAGSYTLGGVCDARGRVTLSPEAWIVAPPNYVMVGMDGDVASDGNFSGRITEPSCGGFALSLAH